MFIFRNQITDGINHIRARVPLESAAGSIHQARIVKSFFLFAKGMRRRG